MAWSPPITTPTLDSPRVFGAVRFAEAPAEPRFLAAVFFPLRDFEFCFGFCLGAYGLLADGLEEDRDFFLADRLAVRRRRPPVESLVSFVTSESFTTSSRVNLR